jgi:hypothetical protein
MATGVWPSGIVAALSPGPIEGCDRGAIVGFGLLLIPLGDRVWLGLGTIPILEPACSSQRIGIQAEQVATLHAVRP